MGTANEKMKESPQETAAMENEKPVNILLVDDQPANLLALEAVLEGLGQNLVRANSGEEALRHLIQKDFAVILLDVLMPGMNGFETAALIRQRDHSRHTPIIFLTAGGNTETEMFQGYAAGAIDYLLKPFIPEVLRSKLSVLMGLHRRSEEMRRMNKELNLKIKEIVILNMKLEIENGKHERMVERFRRSEKGPSKLDANLGTPVTERTVAVAKRGRKMARTNGGLKEKMKKGV